MHVSAYLSTELSFINVLLLLKQIVGCILPLLIGERHWHLKFGELTMNKMFTFTQI